MSDPATPTESERREESREEVARMHALDIAKHPHFAEMKQLLLRKIVEASSTLGKDLRDPLVHAELVAGQRAGEIVLEWVAEIEGAELTIEKMAEASEEAQDSFIRHLTS